MGYTGQAAFALEQAKALIESGFSNSSDSSNWRPSYALHLISIGLVEKRFVLYFTKVAFLIVDSQTYISECETRSIDDYQSMTRSLGNISMLQVRALYFAEVGLISDAVRYAEDAYKTLKKATHLRLKGKKEQEIDNNLQLRVQNEEWILTMVCCDIFSERYCHLSRNSLCFDNLC